MFILELALYGIRNFTQLTRLSFKPGLNLLYGGNGSGKSTIREAFFAILSPISDIPTDYFLGRSGSEGCQAALIFRGDDNRTYRVVRDFAGRKSSLSTLEPNNKFRMTTQKEEAVTKFLTDQVRSLGRETLQGLFSVEASWMPSADTLYIYPAAPSSDQSGPVSPPGGQSTVAAQPGDRAHKQKRLEELKGYLGEADKLARMEDQLADIHSQRSESKRRLQKATEKNSELDPLQAQGTEFESIGKLPEDHHLVLDTSEQQEQIKNEQLASIAETEDMLRQELELIPDQPFFLNQLFMTGGAMVLVSLILAMALDFEGLFQNLLMLILLGGVGLMGYVGFQDFGKLNKRKTLETKLRENELRRTRLEMSFKKENAPCMEWLKKTGCKDIRSLREKTREYDEYLTRQRELEEERDHFLGGKTFEQIEKECEDLSEEISTLEKRLKDASTLPSDVYLIQEEVRILEQQLVTPQADSRQDSEPAVVSPSAPNKAVSGAFPSESPNRLSDIPGPHLRAGLTDPPVRSLLQEKSDALRDQLQKFTNGSGIPIEEGLSLNEQLEPVLPAEDPWARFSSGQRDYLRFAYQMAILQILSDRFPIPLILDNPLTHLDPPRRISALDILREIAQNRQVILLLSSPIPGHESDHQIHLK